MVCPQRARHFHEVVNLVTGSFFDWNNKDL